MAKKKSSESQRVHKAHGKKFHGKATTDAIWQKLVAIESLIKKDIELDKKDLEIDLADIKFDKTSAKAVKATKSDKKRRFTNIIDWKEYIWNSCPHRQQKIGAKQINYFCKKLSKPCGFEQCPINVK